MENQLYLAPMVGITDKPFRQMIRDLSDSILFTEMIGADSFFEKNKNAISQANIQNETRIIPQIVGDNPKTIVLLAKILQDNGALGININMGCPIKKVVANHGGFRLMEYENEALNIIANLKKEIQIPISIKVRLGANANHPLIIPFAKKMQEVGVDLIFLHARFKNEGVSGPVHFEYISLLKEILTIPLIINGGIQNNKQIKDLNKKFGITSFMIGQGALGKPWIFKTMLQNKPLKINYADFILKHFELMLAFYGNKGVFLFKKHLKWYADSLNINPLFFKIVAKEENSKIIAQHIQNYFSVK